MRIVFENGLTTEQKEAVEKLIEEEKYDKANSQYGYVIGY